MLTAKENMKRTIFGGETDRLVNQYEAMSLCFHPFFMAYPFVSKGQENVVNAWGVTNSFPENVPGSFPVHTPDKIVVKDIENWKEYVHAPSLELPEELWKAAEGMIGAADGEKSYKAVMVAPGLFEQTHHLCGMDNALIYYMTNPDEMHELIEYLTEWELEFAKQTCERLHPNMIFHHDDWGSETNSFLRPGMFEEFFLEPYKRIYGYYHDHGVEVVVHHSDSYAANLVPYMIDMGINVWQGPMWSNDIPALLDKYGDKITFMGGIDNKMVDFTGWTEADCHNAAYKVIEACGGKRQGFIPCITQGGPGSVFPGTYKVLSDEICKYNQEKFGFTQEEQENEAPPMVIMF